MAIVAATSPSQQESPIGATAVGWTLQTIIAWLLVVSVVFINAADFRGDTGGEFEVHWQIYLRLFVCSAAGCYGLLNFLPRTAREFFIWPGMLALAYVGLSALSIPSSVNLSYSLAAWVSLVGVALLVPAAIRVLGPRDFLLAILAGLCMHLVGSWIAYLLFPAVGVFHEQVTRDDVFERMGGLAHPNELGFYSALTILLAASLGTRRQLGTFAVCIAVALGAATLVTCFSRTAMISCAIGLAVVWKHHLVSRGNAVALTMLACVGVLGVFAALGTGKLDWQIAELMTKVTKSGSTDELATATGRTEIWRYAVGLIGESPLVGYGYCAARFVMEDHSYHGHNIVINAMLFSGIPGGLVVITMVAVLLMGIVFMPRPEIDGCAACLIFGGMLDGVIGAPAPAAGLVIWLACLFWRQLGLGFHGEAVRQ